MARDKEPRAPARAEIDITPNLPTKYDPFQCWPYSIPDPRPIPYGKPGKRIRVLILPGRIEYDPAMHKVEKRIRKLMAEGLDVMIVVPDVWRGVGEIMARRNGLNLMVLNTDNAGATHLPSNYGFEKFAGSKVARRRVLREADLVLMIDSHIAYTQIKADLAEYHPDTKVKTYEHMYVRKKAITDIQKQAVKDAVRKKIKDTDKKPKKRKKK